MNINNFLFQDTTGKKSVTMTAFILGCMVINVKLLFAGIKIGEYSMPPFGGSDYSLALASLGGVYVLRRHPALSGDKASGSKE